MSTLLWVAVLLNTCVSHAFVVNPGANLVAMTPRAAAPPAMLFGLGAPSTPKKAKKAAKKAKVVKKAKKVVKKVVKKPVKKSFKGPSAAQPGTGVGDLVSGFFSEKNWGVQAVTILNPGEGVPTTTLALGALWVLFVLRFVIFYGFFGDAS